MSNDGGPVEVEAMWARLAALQAEVDNLKKVVDTSQRPLVPTEVDRVFPGSHPDHQHERRADAGRFLAEHRRGKISVIELAKKLKVTPTFVSQVEKGRTKMPDAQLLRWATFINADVKEVAANLCYHYRPMLFTLLTEKSAGEQISPEFITFLLSTPRKPLDLPEIARRIGYTRKQATGIRAATDIHVLYPSLLSFYIRKKRGERSQLNLAEIIGYGSATTVAQVEHGKIQIRDDKILKWNEILGAESRVFGSLCLMAYAPNAYSVLSDEPTDMVKGFDHLANFG